MIQAALIGYGYWGKVLAGNMTSYSGINLKYICDNNTEAFLKNPLTLANVSLTNSIQDIFNDKELDLVVIATPPLTHFEVAKQVITSGLNVMIEKPMTMNTKDATELCDLATSKEVMIFMDHVFAFHSSTKVIKESIKVHGLKDLIGIKTQRSNPEFFDKGVDVLWDLYPHDLSVIFDIFPDIEISNFNVMPFKLTGERNDYFNIILRTDDDVIIDSTVSWLSRSKIRTMDLFFKNGTIRYDSSYKDTVMVFKDQLESVNMIPDEDALHSQFNAIGECLETGIPYTHAGEVGLGIVSILEACDEAGKLNADN